MVQAEVRLAEEEDRGIRAVAMGWQGAWTKWKTTTKKDDLGGYLAQRTCTH